jgi:chemotaxis protein CheD
MGDPITVGLGQFAVSRDPEAVIVAFGLGSCLGIAMYDPQRHIGGLLHAVLPEQHNPDAEADARYVVSGIHILLDAVVKAGASRSNLVLRMAGGATMLMVPGSPSAFEIGKRNIEAAYATLSQMRLSLSSEETGGHGGRTMRMYIGTGRVTIRTMGQQERDIIDLPVRTGGSDNAMHDFRARTMPASP